MQIQSAKELLFHLRNLAVSTQATPSSDPGHEDNLRVHGPNPSTSSWVPGEYSPGKNTAPDAEKPLLVSVKFDGVSVMAVDLPVTYREKSLIRDAYQANVNTLYQAALRHRALVEEKQQAARDADRSNRERRSKAYEAATQAMQEAGFSRTACNESTAVYETTFEQYLEAHPLIDIPALGIEYNHRIMKAVTEKSPGLYKPGIDGDWRRYEATTDAFRRKLAAENELSLKS